MRRAITATQQPRAIVNAALDVPQHPLILRTALRAAADRQGPTLIEIDQALWMKAVAV
jgi:hypothetical protein